MNWQALLKVKGNYRMSKTNWAIWIQITFLLFIHIWRVTFLWGLCDLLDKFRWALQYGRTLVTHKNLVYDLAHHESPTHVAQWSERHTGIWRVMGSTPVGVSENSFSEYLDLRMLLQYLYFIQVTNPFIIYSHLSFRHVELCSMAGHMSHM